LPSVTIQRVQFSASVDSKLRQLKARTGITPNVLCRIGFCLSLEERGIPAKPLSTEGVGREMNRYTLLGECDVVFVSLLKTWAQSTGVKVRCNEDLNQALVAHMNRGAELLAARVRTLSDLRKIYPKSP
jgi:DNA sulfur modification protein DndE